MNPREGHSKGLMIRVVSIGGAILFGSVRMRLVRTTRGLPCNPKANRFRWVLATAAIGDWGGFCAGHPALTTCCLGGSCWSGRYSIRCGGLIASPNGRATGPAKSIHDHKNPPEEVVAAYQSHGICVPVSILMGVEEPPPGCGAPHSPLPCCMPVHPDIPTQQISRIHGWSGSSHRRP